MLHFLATVSLIFWYGLHAAVIIALVVIMGSLIVILLRQ